MSAALTYWSPCRCETFPLFQASTFVLVKQVNFSLQLVVDLLPDFGGCEEKLLVFSRQHATERSLLALLVQNDLLPDFGGCEEKLLVFLRQQFIKRLRSFGVSPSSLSHVTPSTLNLR
jgi:hypothetical protein